MCDCENCFVFKEISGAQPTVLVVLVEKQLDRLGRGGVVPRTRTLEREEESGGRHLGKLKGSVDLGHFGTGCFASLSLGFLTSKVRRIKRQPHRLP